LLIRTSQPDGTAFTIKSVDGEVMGGVTVSARADSANVVTSVFTDEAGNYYFPPMAEGKYKVWAQAITFETGRGDVALGAAKRQDLVLNTKSFIGSITTRVRRVFSLTTSQALKAARLPSLHANSSRPLAQGRGPRG
jgi:hypothetical protein